MSASRLQPCSMPGCTRKTRRSVRQSDGSRRFVCTGPHEGQAADEQPTEYIVAEVTSRPPAQARPAWSVRPAATEIRCCCGNDSSAGWLDGMCLACWEAAQVAVPVLLADAVASMETHLRTEEVMPHEPGDRGRLGHMTTGPVAIVAGPVLPSDDEFYVPEYHVCEPEPRALTERRPEEGFGLLDRLRATWAYGLRIREETAGRWYPYRQQPKAQPVALWAWLTVGGLGLLLLSLEAGMHVGWRL
jgi:hypothetical protein